MNYRHLAKPIVVCILAFLPFDFVLAKVNIVTSLPDIAWAAREIGGDNVEVKSLLKGTEDPHYVDAVPEFVRLVSNADIVCSVGLELEVGWLPKVLSRSGNARVQPNGTGYCQLGKAVDTLEKPSGPVNRSMGDVHPAGNPHFWLSPKAFGKASSQILEALIRVDSKNAETYRKNYGELQKKLDSLVEKSHAKLKPLLAQGSGPQIIEYHREFAYLVDLYKIRSYGSIEEKPGVPPSAGRIAEVSTGAKAAGVKVILATDYNPRKTIDRVRELSGAKVVIVPSSVQPDRSHKDYVQLHEHIVNALSEKLAERKP